jgi:hypothetical protein
LCSKQFSVNKCNSTRSISGDFEYSHGPLEDEHSGTLKDIIVGIPNMFTFCFVCST